jgi:uncharacterized protein (DUF58 family)
MGYRGGAAMTKMEYGAVLAAALAFLMHRQRDATGLITFDDRIRFRLPATARPGQLHALLLALERVQPGTQSNMARPLNHVSEALLKRGLVVLISDLLDDPQPVVQSLKRLRIRGTDVIVFHVLDSDELTFPFRGAARFRDLENGEEIVADPAVVRTAYLEEIGNLTRTYERELRAAGIDYVQVDTSKPLDFALMPYLSARGRRS